MHRIRLSSTSLFSLLFTTAAVAQGLELDVRGGSMPGVIQVDTYPGLIPGELGMIIPSTNPGPTPLWPVSPLDPRSLDVGIDLLGLAWLGVYDLTGHFAFGVPIGSDPALQDMQLYLQSVTFAFGANLLDRISNPAAIRLGLSHTFRDRGVFFNDARAFATAIPRPDRKTILVGGGAGQLLAQVAVATTAIYDPWTDTCTPGPGLNTARSMHGATKLADGRWLLTGGVDTNNDPQASCEIYDPVADTFTAVAPMGTPRMGHTATLLGNGKVLVTGGLHAMTVTPTQLSAIHDADATSELYDPLTDTWTPGPNLSTPRAAHFAFTRPDGKVLLGGGISWDTVIIVGWLPAIRRSCDLYDPVANAIGSAPQMVTPRSTVDPVDLGNGRWLLAGGISSLSLTNPGSPTAAAEIYDAATNTWTAVGAMATARGNHKAWALGNGQFLLAGGANGSILSPTALDSSEIFSTTTNTFSSGPTLTSARAGAAALPSAVGQMQLFGGASTGGSISYSTEWYFF